MTEIVSGQDLIDAGMQQGKWFAPALAAANAVLEKGGSHEDAIETARSFAPPPAMPLHASGALPLHLNIQAENPHEAANVEAVTRSMIELMRTPVVRAGAIMPDACPAGSPGTIPVGGVAVSEGIHPGMHSADICCSMAISVFPGVAPAALLDAVHWIGHPTIRRHGSIGGSISHADPTAELPAAAVLYDASMVVRSMEGERRIAAADFFESAYVTALQPGDLLVAVEFPIPPANSTGSFLEIGERRGDFAIASVGTAIEFDGGAITKAAIVCCGADLVAIRAPDIEAFLVGKPLDAPPAKEAGAMFAAGVEPSSDHVAGAEYKSALIGELTQRAIEAACARALERT